MWSLLCTFSFPFGMLMLYYGILAMFFSLVGIRFSKYRVNIIVIQTAVLRLLFHGWRYFRLLIFSFVLLITFINITNDKFLVHVTIGWSYNQCYISSLFPFEFFVHLYYGCRSRLWITKWAWNWKVLFRISSLESDLKALVNFNN